MRSNEAQRRAWREAAAEARPGAGRPLVDRLRLPILRSLRAPGQHPGRSGMDKAGPVVGIIMGSQSDWQTMQHAAATLDRLGVAFETRIVSAHRTPSRLYDYARSARQRGLRAIIPGRRRG